MLHAAHDDATFGRRLLEALGQARSLIAVLRGPNFVYEFVNDAYRAIIDLEGDPIGQPFGATMHPAAVPLRKVLERVYRTGEPWVGSEIKVADVIYDVHFRALRGASGEVEGIVIQSFDVTELVRTREAREKMQAQLLQVQKLESLGVMAGGIAHDFNNLLTGILGNASIALLKIPRDSPARPSLDDIVAIGRRAADLTRQLLAYSGKGRFQVRPVDLSTHVKEIAQLLESSLPKKVQLRIEVGEGMPAIDADVAQLQQVVMNLVLNAGESIADERGVVRVSTGEMDLDEPHVRELLAPEPIAAGRYVFLEVQDTGCGMDEATRTKIFDPFFTTKFSGRGLGLAAVLGIVRGHKGAIKIDSAPSRGTTFRVLFPASDRAAVSSHRSPQPVARGEGCVLVVDDERELRETASRILEHFGFDTLQARNGRDAVEKFGANAEKIRAVLLDMTMPEMNGEEAFREMRRIRAVPVILTSGYDEVEASRRFTEKGLAGFLQKPYSADELGEAIVGAITRGLEKHGI